MALRNIASLLALAAARPPLYEITADSLYDAGKQHGRLAAERIQKWLVTDEMNNVWNFSRQDERGKAAYAAIRRDSTAAHPVYATELKGIAEGAQVDLDKLWAANLMIELENMMRLVSAAEHCSDIYAISPGGYQQGFAEGHNEDWSQEVGELYYYIKYTPASPDADFASCAGLAYPGALIGWAPTWNAHGMFMSVNTLYPKEVRSHGLTTSFVQRDAICGLGKGDGMDSVLSGLEDPRWAEGASVNLVDLQHRRMANIEVHEAQHNVFEVTEEDGNYSHFNAYKRLDPSIQLPQASSAERQALANSFPPPRSREAIVEMLSDRTSINGSVPIMRDITIATLLLDGDSGDLDVWCCGTTSGSGPENAVHRWNLNHFFEPAPTAVV